MFGKMKLLQQKIMKCQNRENKDKSLLKSHQEIKIIKFFKIQDNIINKTINNNLEIAYKN